MAGSDLTIRRFHAADAAAWRTIRLEALREAPVAFGQTLENAIAAPPESFVNAVSSANPIVGAFDGGTAIGTAGIYVIDGPKSGHRGMLWGMYVAPPFRRQGVGERLIVAVLAEAPPGVAQVHLRVVTDNAPAYRLYRRMGFVAYGIEPSALRWQGRDYDETMMVRMLGLAPPKTS